MALLANVSSIRAGKAEVLRGYVSAHRSDAGNPVSGNAPLPVRISAMDYIIKVMAPLHVFSREPTISLYNYIFSTSFIPSSPLIIYGVLAGTRLYA